MDSKKNIQIGKIYREHGIHGACKVSGFDTTASYLTPESRCVLIAEDGREQEAEVIECKPFNDRFLLVRFSVFDTPEAIIPWRKAGIWVPREELAESEGDDLYDYEWEGYEVLDESGAVVGTVTRIEYTPLRQFGVATGKGQVLIPYVLDWFVKLDKKKKQLILNLPEGLIES